MMANGGLQSAQSRVKHLEQLVNGQAPVGGANPFQEALDKLEAQGRARVSASIVNPSQATGAPVPVAPMAAVSGKMSERVKAFKPTIEALSQQHGVDSKLVMALIKQESGFNPNAVSSAGAQGLMQLMPATAKGLGVTNPMDPTQNLAGGIKYLKSMLDRHNGNIPLALASYNAGPGAVAKYDGIPPYKETQNYVRSILKTYLKSQA
jgi:soluble lytic murein transglycosylase-like protein